MGILTDLRDRFIVAPIAKQIADSLGKAQGSDEVHRFATPIGYNDQVFNKVKPGSGITYTQLRNISRAHDISRACITVKKRQITQLNWDITPVNSKPGDTTYAAVIPVIRAFFSTIGGYNTKMRKFLDMIVEDWMVVDAVSMERRRTRGGAFLGLILADPTTIKVRVNEQGLTPMPPEVAYEQWLFGRKSGDFTADQMIYDMLNPRTDSPYGFSPQEALVMTVEQALRSRMYSLSYFTDGTVPEGFYELPATWTIDQIKQFQSHFDSMMSGDSRMQRKVKFMPSSGGKGFQASKDFDFSGIQPYEEWLMRVTCALFGVMPTEIGFTDGVNRSTSEEQTEIAKRLSIKPIAQAIEELFNEILWTERLALTDKQGKVVQEIGPFPELQFTFLNLDKKDEFIDSQVTEKLVSIGAISVDEWREERGLLPIGLGPYISTASGPILVANLTVSGTGTQQYDSAENDASVANQSAAQETSPEQDIKRWEKKALADLKEGRPFRKFSSEVLDEFTLITLAHDLELCTDREEIHNLFATWKKSVNEGVTADATRLFKKLGQLTEA